MSSYKYARYISHVARHPFAILPEKFMVITELFRARAAGAKFTDEEIVERIAADPSRDRQSVSSGGSIAVIPVHGVIAHRADSFEASSGGTSTELIGRVLSRAVADDSITAILLDFDTPGGSVEGVPELAAKIAKWTAFKPIVGHINALCASAGYWLGSQCSELIITPSGMAGSIGVFMVLVDQSEQLAKEGIKVNAISAGDFKLEGASWEPLSDEARAHLQGQVNVVYKDFLSAVAKGRDVAASDVKANYGQGRVFDAKESLARGMVDRVATIEDTLARVMSPRYVPAKRAAADTSYRLVTTIADQVTEIEGTTLTLEDGHVRLERADDPVSRLSPEEQLAREKALAALANDNYDVPIGQAAPVAVDPEIAIDDDRFEVSSK